MAERQTTREPSEAARRAGTVRHHAVSFADSTATPGQITFNLDRGGGLHQCRRLQGDIAAKKAAGKSVILSIGGEKGNVHDQQRRLATPRQQRDALMQEYGFRVDVDLEHGINSPT
ncbi:hypothetical protein [Streptomyces cremeus]|uniref:hypothetical protein n=1 Tax=Streptomyces cremeus TaxID=66881 RepID=UPI0033762238